MKKWEYTHRRWYHTNAEKIEKDIKELGDEEWRLAKVVGRGSYIVAFFEREKIEDGATILPEWFQPINLARRQEILG